MFSSFLRKRRKILLYTTIVAHVVVFVGCSSWTHGRRMVPDPFLSSCSTPQKRRQSLLRARFRPSSSVRRYLLNFLWSFQCYGEVVCIGPRSKEYQHPKSSGKNISNCRRGRLTNPHEPQEYDRSCQLLPEKQFRNLGWKACVHQE